MLTNPPCDPLPRARAAHPVLCADGRARREQLLRHLHVTVARSVVQRRESALPGARAVSARPRPAPAPTPPAGGPRSTENPIPLFPPRAPRAVIAPPEKTAPEPYRGPPPRKREGGRDGGSGGAAAGGGRCSPRPSPPRRRAPRSAAPRPPRAHSALPCGAPSTASRRAANQPLRACRPAPPLLPAPHKRRASAPPPSPCSAPAPRLSSPARPRSENLRLPGSPRCRARAHTHNHAPAPCSAPRPGPARCPRLGFCCSSPGPPARRPAQG